MNINRVAVVGGGTAGWLTANYLGVLSSQKAGLEVTLIESPDIPTIGVGEGTVPAMRETLRHFGISEATFLNDCDATFKQSIKFVNWLDRGSHGCANHYHHLFDYPFPFGENFTDFWLSRHPAKKFTDIVSVQGHLCDASLAPKKITTPEYQGEAEYAYHLDAGKFVKLLSNNAREKFGVKHLLRNIVDVDIDDQGYVESLKTDSDETLSFDFYVDCSGFSALLLGQHLDVEFVDKSDQLLTNAALVTQVSTDTESAIPSHTIATAHQAGWVWDIHLQSRRGVGFVYSDNHMTDAQAALKFSKYLGKTTPEDYRKIRMPVGRRKKFWQKNCVAIGLSQGFVEPLEATAILMADYSAKLLAEKMPAIRTDCEVLAQRFNRALIYAWDRVLDFIKMHYYLSDRTDSDFWNDNRNPETISGELAAMLIIWQSHTPSLSDFFSKFEVFDIENYAYVLHGMKYRDKPYNHLQPPSESVQQGYEKILQRRARLMKELPGNRALLEKVRQFGFQQI